ncbi:hypothetical protein BDW62DRAFT_198184 [Aspergillus aurantiobrunneus]
MGIGTGTWGLLEKTVPYLIYQEASNVRPMLTIHYNQALIDVKSLILIWTDFKLFFHGFSFPSRVPFTNYTKAIASCNSSEAESFWRGYLDGYHGLSLVGTLAAESKVVESRVQGDVELLAQVEEFAQKFQVDVKVVLLAGWAATLSRHLETDDVAFYTNLRVYSFDKTEYIVGPMGVTAPLRVRLPEGQSTLEMLQGLEAERTTTSKYSFIGGTAIDAQSQSKDRLQSAFTVLELEIPVRPVQGFHVPMHVACVQPSSHEDASWPQLVSALRTATRSNLPWYMTPAYWLQFDTLPLNSNGKTDILQLRRQIETMAQSEMIRSLVDPSADRPLLKPEQTLQIIWADVLRLPTDLVPATHSFQALGDDSLKALRVISELLARDYVLELGNLLRRRSSYTVLRQAGTKSHRCCSACSVTTPLFLSTRRSINTTQYKDAYPATLFQEGVISAHLQAGGYVYHRVFRITGYSVPRLQAAFQAVVRSNPIYRTSFIASGSWFLQGVNRDFQLPWEVVNGVSVDEYISRPDVQGVDVDIAGPLVRAAVLNGDILVNTMHHALFDYWSSRFIFRDAAAAYHGRAVVARRPFSIFVRHLGQSVDKSTAAEFWREYLQGAAVTRLTAEAAPFHVGTRTLKGEVDLRAFTVSAGVMPGALMYAAWAIILWKYTGNADVTFGITLSGRDAPIQGVQELNGPTMTTVPIRVRLDTGMALGMVVEMVQHELWRVARFSQVGLGQALRASAQDAGLLDSMVNFLVEEEEMQSGSFELRMPGYLQDIRTAFILDKVVLLLETIASSSGTALGDVDIVPASETSYLEQMSTKAATDARFLHDAFEATAAASGDRVAVEFEKALTVTYRALNARANQLAGYLVSKGVGLDTLVPLCLPKFVEMIACILAILKAGGGFVPLDPDNSPERNKFIVADVGARMVLTDENLRGIFDVAIGDIFCTLGCGAVLCMAPMESLLADLTGVINAMQVTRLFLTPTVAKLIHPADVPGLQGIYLAGEPVTPDLVEMWTPHCAVMNCYGLTEASILAAAGVLERGDNAKVIGRPFRNCTAMILEPGCLRLAPYGAVGELCLCGAQLARGYLNRPEATEEAFVMRGAERVYRTGDLARWLPETRIECFGRRDSQVKINGHRIESAILKTGSVQQVAVAVVEVQGQAQLVAFCVTEAGSSHGILPMDEHSETLTAVSISLTSLPPYMVPSIWIPTGTLPLIPSAKTDRKRLLGWIRDMSADALQEYSSAGAKAEFVEPVTTEEVLLQGLWASLFNKDPSDISSTSAFFAHGGDSISAINLVSKCKSQGYTLAVSDVLAFPLLQEMAGRMKPARTAHTQTQELSFAVPDHVIRTLSNAGIPAADIIIIYPAPPGVEDFLVRGAQPEQFWQCQTVRPLLEAIDFDHWVHVTAGLTARNEILRSMWLDVEGTWLQPVLDIEIINCRSEQDKQDQIVKIWNSPFEITNRKPFIRYRLHLPDGCRDSCSRSTTPSLSKNIPPRETVPFRAYVSYMQSTDRETSLTFWKDLLHNHQAPFPNTPNPMASALTIQTTTRKVDSFAATSGVTVPIVFQTAFSLLLSLLSGKTDIVYENLITGRNVDMLDAQNIAGTCACFLPFRGAFSSETTIRELLKSTQALFWQITEHGNVSMNAICTALGKRRVDVAARALFLFQPFDQPVSTADVVERNMRWMVMALSKVRMPIDYALHLEVARTATGYSLKFKYDPRVYGDGIEGVTGAFLEILRRMMAQSRIRVGVLLG